MKRLSPAHFLGVAALILVPFLVLHLAGIRHWTSIVSLTFPENIDQNTAIFVGGLYIVLWAGVVVVVPILVLGTLFWAGIDRLTRRRS